MVPVHLYFVVECNYANVFSVTWFRSLNPTFVTICSYQTTIVRSYYLRYVTYTQVLVYTHVVRCLWLSGQLILKRINVAFFRVFSSLNTSIIRDLFVRSTLIVTHCLVYFNIYLNKKARVTNWVIITSVLVMCVC